MWQKDVAKLQEIEKHCAGPIMPGSDLKLGGAQSALPWRAHLHKYQGLKMTALALIFKMARTQQPKPALSHCHRERGSTRIARAPGGLSSCKDIGSNGSKNLQPSRLQF